MPNRLLTRNEVNRDILAPYCRQIAHVLRVHPPKPGKVYIPGLFDSLGMNLSIENDAETEQYAKAFEKLADDLTQTKA